MMSLVSLRILTLMASGPHALWILRSFRRFSMPCVVIEMSGIVGYGLGPLSGRSLAGSLVNTDFNCLFNGLALPKLSVMVFASDYSEVILTWSRLMFLM